MRLTKTLTKTLKMMRTASQTPVPRIPRAVLWSFLPLISAVYVFMLDPWLERPPLIYPNAGKNTYAAAAPGDWGSFNVVWVRARHDCVLMPETVHPYITASDGLRYLIGSDRGGIPASVPANQGAFLMKFRVPDMVPPGPAPVTLTGKFRCGRLQTRRSYPTFLFEVLGPGEDG